MLVMTDSFLDKVIVSDDNVKIIDSYLIHKKDFKKDLNLIREAYPDNNVMKHRKNCGMKLEWATHNLLYDWGIMRSHTKDVDLNYPRKWYATIGYTLVGIFALMIIE